ncbi:MAG: NUMOD4 motif-containing HNH endonuclease [Patescibacteria group bacterium]|nr:NUMOD4 motif-containing HNH endonuclease [Patescibacteria group bacterium]
MNRLSQRRTVYWRNIKGYEGKYLVSSDGKVRSVRRDQELSQHPNSTGYLRVSLPCASRSRKAIDRFVHRLVAEAYIENPDKLPVVNHKDGNPVNNNVSNLEWVTRSENSLHYFRVLGNPGSFSGRTGWLHPQSKPVAMMSEDGTPLEIYANITDAALIKGLSSSSVWDAATGRSKTCLGHKWSFSANFSIV